MITDDLCVATPTNYILSRKVPERQVARQEGLGAAAEAPMVQGTPKDLCDAWCAIGWALGQSLPHLARTTSEPGTGSLPE